MVQIPSYQTVKRIECRHFSGYHRRYIGCCLYASFSETVTLRDLFYVVTIVGFKEMDFSAEDKILIKELRETKGYGERRLITEFPMKNWSLAGVSKLLKKIATTGSVARKPRDRALRTQTNINAVEELVLSQDRMISRARICRCVLLFGNLVPEPPNFIRVYPRNRCINCNKICRL